jgi:hypothetical protein
LAVAFAFLIVMAFATMPSPLYGLYRARDGLLAVGLAAGTGITYLIELRPGRTRKATWFAPGTSAQP